MHPRLGLLLTKSPSKDQILFHCKLAQKLEVKEKPPFAHQERLTMEVDY